jgi:hypothetical protein
MLQILSPLTKDGIKFTRFHLIMVRWMHLKEIEDRIVTERICQPLIAGIELSRVYFVVVAFQAFLLNSKCQGIGLT